MMYRHGLRVSEAIGMRRDHVNLPHSRLWVARLKSSLSVEHPIAGDELRALRKLKREASNGEFVFTSERGGPFSTKGFAAMIERAGKAARLAIKVHPHML